MRCRNQMQIQDLEKSGFIHLPSHCSATIGKHQLRKRGGTLRRVSVDQKKKLLIQQGTSDSAVALMIARSQGLHNHISPIKNDWRQTVQKLHQESVSQELSDFKKTLQEQEKTNEIQNENIGETDLWLVIGVGSLGSCFVVLFVFVFYLSCRIFKPNCCIST